MPGVKDWVKKASGELKMAKKGADEADTFDQAVYHTHQCAEKILKAFLIFMQQPVPKTHDLEYLHRICARFDHEFHSLKNECAILNPYGHDSRYPDDSFSVDQQAVEGAIIMAEKVFKFVKKKLNQDEINLSIRVLEE